MEAEECTVLVDLKKRLYFWKRDKSLRESLPAKQLRDAPVESTDGLLKPDDMELLKALTRTL